MVRVLVGGILAGLVVFVWGAVSHMATPIGEMGLKAISGEEKVLRAMKESIGDPGIYFFPGRDMSKKMTGPEEEAYAEKIKQGPAGLLVIQPTGAEMMSPRQLLTELGSGIAAAIVAALVLTQVRSGYVGRVLIVTAMGVFGFLSILVSYWNWYAFPTEFITGQLLDEVIGWFLGGLVLAAIVRPAKIVEKSTVAEEKLS
jgi:hypothetical protein